jgi:hypothetical protein
MTATELVHVQAVLVARRAFLPVLLAVAHWALALRLVV